MAGQKRKKGFFSGMWKDFITHYLPFLGKEEAKAVIRDDINKYLDHTASEIDKAKLAYCDALLEIAKSRVEAQYQLVRYREMQKILAMMQEVDTKSLEQIEQELEQYTGIKQDSFFGRR